jgi:2-keto-4-pentenoate hydratase/2-oxohepta-3-ene-1,7-dioic acid hydratase in catechol pathway
MNYEGRAHLVFDDGLLDVHRASDGRFSTETDRLYGDWTAFATWARSQAPSAAALTTPHAAVDPHRIGPPSPNPRQIFAIGLNYTAHAAESAIDKPAVPPTFTKFVTSLTGPNTEVVLPSDWVDWEVELVVVMGAPAHHVSVESAWGHVAGVTLGQDLSERVVQMTPPVPQFSLGKSFPGFSPIGPVLVTPDELDNPDDIEIGCSVDGEQMQRSSTADMIFPVPQLVEHLSRIVTLLPGDIIFTGTPSGVGAVRSPARFLKPDEVLESFAAGVGTMRQTFVAAP